MTFEEILERDGSLVYTNVGVSMMPLLREKRDLMILEKKGQIPLKKLDVVLFRRKGVTGRGAYVLHRILRVNADGTYWIVGDNCATGETVAEEQILAVLRAVARNGKTLNVTDRRFRLYTHVWCDCYPARFFVLRLRDWFHLNWGDQYTGFRCWEEGFEIQPHGSGKGQGMTWIRAHSGLEIRKTVGTGDFENDISLVRDADIGYAVDNALPCVKAAA